ncbi:MAG: carboxypeptidase regulatory-like domain-containing protein, partial [Thermoplasmatales archaeon]
DYIDITTDIAATWKVTFERFFDIWNLIKRIDFVSSSIDANFSLRYEPPTDIYNDSYIKLNIHEESSMELLEIVNHYVSRFDKIITIGKMHFNPGEISFYWRIYEEQGIGFLNVDNDDLIGEFDGLTLRKGFYEIKFLDVSIIKPGKTNIGFELNNDSGSLDISNSAELEFTLLEFTEGIDILRLERDLDFGVISMLPGEFDAEWINLSDDDYDKELTINNGIFELTILKFVLQVGKLKVSLSLLNTDREYNNPITVKLRQQGKGNRGFCITTDDPLQFDLFSIKMSGASWEFIIDLLELKADFNEWYLGMWDGKLTIGGNGTVKIVNLSRYINITFKWKGEDSKEQKIFSQYCSSWQDHPQTHALLIDTTNCTEKIDLIYNTEINELELNSQLEINPQKYFTLHFDINPEPFDNSTDGHLFIDTENEEIGNLAIEINKYVDYFGVDIGLYAEIELLKADEFHIWGEFIETEIFGMKFWIPSEWGKSGSIDFVNIGLVKLIFGIHETEIWPCTPKAIPDKNQYGVTLQNPLIDFDISDSEGFVFKLQWMRWDWDGDGSWDTGSAPYHWIGFEEYIEYDFSEMFENEEESIKVFFQVKTVAAISNIAEVSIIKGYTLDLDIQYDGDKLYESMEFNVIVSNSTSNTPVSNAYVEYHQFNVDGSENVSSNYTDSNGKAGFITSEVPYDYYIHYSTAKLYVEADGYLDFESELFKIYDTEADLHGYIRDNVTHMGISNALILAEPGGYYTYSEEYYGWQNGKFKLLVPPGIYDITISKYGFSSFIIQDFNAIEGGYHNLGDLYLLPNDYGGLRGVVYDATTNDEIYGVKVTVEIPGEDDIVTTTDYFGEFPNNYPSSDEYYSIDLEPGTYIVKFEINNYYTYTEQVTIFAGDITDINVYLFPEWVTPFGHNNPTEWHDEEEAHDNQLDTASYTDIYWGLTWHWTEPLELFLHSSFNCDKVRIYAKYIENRCDQTKVEIYYNNAWHEVYTGSFNHKSWYEIEFDNEYIISKARVSFRIKKYFGVPTNAELYEFNFG